MSGFASTLGATMLVAWLTALATPTGLMEWLLPQSVERWLWNPRERTEKAMAAAREGRPDEALVAIDAALRLAPDDPRVNYDAGTLHLAAGDARGALEPLARAAQAAPPDLAAAAWYNLGGARLAAGDAAGAVEALKEALRRAPSDLATKHNLELALAEREQEKRRWKSPREGDRGDREGKGESSPKGGGAGANDTSGDSGQTQGQNPKVGPDGKPQPGDSPQAAGDSKSRARIPPRFRDQPDMTAAQAEAILRAVENLERTERQKLAAARAQAVNAEIDDW